MSGYSITGQASSTYVDGKDFQASVFSNRRFSEMLAAIKSIPGRKWDAAKKTWIVPCDFKAFQKALKGFEYQVGKTYYSIDGNIDESVTQNIADHNLYLSSDEDEVKSQPSSDEFDMDAFFNRIEARRKGK